MQTYRAIYIGSAAVKIEKPPHLNETRNEMFPVVFEYYAGKIFETEHRGSPPSGD